MIILSNLAPICVPPPEPPFEGYLNVSSPVHDVVNVETCRTDGEDLELICPSFLTVYIRSALYGRKAEGSILCNGEKNIGPSNDCIDTGVLMNVRAECQGNYRCKIGVTGILANLSQDCNTITKELNVTHTCGKHLLTPQHILT